MEACPIDPKLTDLRVRDIAPGTWPSSTRSWRRACGAQNTVDAHSRLCRPTAEQRAAWERDPSFKTLAETVRKAAMQFKARRALGGRIGPQ